MHLKIPPPVVALICALLMGLNALPGQFGSFEFEFRGFPVLDLAAIVLLVVGLSIDIASLLSFRKTETTINPLKPETASRLVSTGLYRFSRNPMYLGILIVLIAWALWLANWFIFIGPALFVAFITKFQIIPEEQALEKLFPEDFKKFRQSTRRWL